MKCIAMNLVLMLGLMPLGVAQRAVFEGDALSGFLEPELPESVSVSFRPADVDAPAMLRVDCATRAPLSVPLFRVPMTAGAGVDFVATGTLRAEDVQGNAYQELWCTLPGGESYFSRALDTAMTGTTGWATHRTPFFLEEEQTAESVTVGVRFEGTGTVYVRQLALQTMPGGLAGLLRQPGGLGGLLGAAVGILGGLWGAMAGALAPSGKARRPVMGTGYVLLLAGIALALAGLAMLITGTPCHQWYAFMLAGGILTVVLGVVLPVVSRRYREAEARHMQQVDSGEGL